MDDGQNINDSEWKIFADELLEKSKYSFISSIETYNKIICANKLETFVILMVNAWELFLKSKLLYSERNMAAIYYNKKDMKSYSIAKVLRKIYCEDNSAIRKNIEFLIEMRDQATHLLVSEVSPDVSRLFQASVNFYIQEYTSFTGENIFESQNIGMLSLVIPGNTDFLKIRSKYGAKIFDRITNFKNKINDTEDTLGKDAGLFIVPVVEKLHLEKSKTKADFTVTTGDDAQDAIQILKHINDPKDVYFYKFSDVITKIKNIDSNFSSHILTNIIKADKIKSNREYSFEMIVGQYRYSEKFINYLTTKLK